MLSTSRRLAVVLGAILMAAQAAAWSDDGEPVATPDFETGLVLKNAAGDEAREFKSGEAITLVVTIRNRTGERRTLTLPSSQTHDCLVYTADHKEVWRHSLGQMFAQVIIEQTLEPGESRTYTATWNQADAKGKPVPPGKYEAVGLVPARAPGCRSDAVSFTIRPGLRKARQAGGLREAGDPGEAGHPREVRAGVTWDFPARRALQRPRRTPLPLQLGLRRQN